MKTTKDYRPRRQQLNSRGWCMVGIMSDHYRVACGYPLRQAVRYTEAENIDLLAQQSLGFSVEEISQWHQRSVNGVSGQLVRLNEMRRG